MRKFLLIALCFFPLTARAQTIQVGAWPNGTLDLSGDSTQWHTHSGDDPAWGQSAFDDTAWPAVSLASQPGSRAGWAWFRIRLHLSDPHAPLALLVTGGDGTWEVYANGRKIPGPSLLPPLQMTYPRSRVVPLNASGDVEIALRTFVPESSMFLADRGAFRVEVGNLPAIESDQRAEASARLNAVDMNCAMDLLQIAAGIAVLLLFRLQRDHREYLWLGLYLTVNAVAPFFFLLATFGMVPFSCNWLIATPAVWLTSIMQIEFTFSFVGQRVNRAWRTYEALLLAYPALLMYPGWNGLITRSLFNTGEMLFTVPVAIAMPILLLVWYRRGYREAAWIILPSLLPVLSVAIEDISIVASYMGWNRLVPLGQSLPLGPFQIFPFAAAGLLFLVAIGIVMFIRFTRVSQEQARAAAEFDAAREVQQYLIPSRLPSTPGLAIESDYRPAREVGGDFFQVLPLPSGSTLIVIGDVAGKGLQAGMLAALIIGAIRMAAKFTTEPGEILALLNERLQGRGLVTCQALRITVDGSAILANAGHLPPYLNGREIAIVGSLPLGAIPGIDFPLLRFHLDPGGTLTLISDGVVEAQNPAGELFGFDRTAAISTQTADQIAKAAERFGQEDDITVLTVMRAV